MIANNTSEIRKTKVFIDLLHRNMEKVIVKSYLISKFCFYINQKMTLDEFKMTNLSDDVRFLCIGCGSFPWTLLTLGVVKNWKFVGIDIDRDAVESARRLVNYFNLSEKIEIIEADAMDFDVSEFDLISISFGVEHKGKLLSKIAVSMKRDGKILFRTTWEILQIVYGRETIPRNFKIIDVYYRLDGIKSYLLEVDYAYTLD